MHRLTRLAALARAASVQTAPAGVAVETQAAAWGAVKAWTASFSGSAASHAATGAVDLTQMEDNATGPEKEELDSLAKGVDPFHEAWLDAPFGTEDTPVEVTSEFAERMVGVPDPDDDSLVWWGMLEEGQPPRQIVEGGEFFVLKRLPSSGGHH